MIAVEENRLVRFKNVQDEIAGHMTQILDCVNKIKGLVKVNKKSKENPAGVLTMPESEYYECLQVIEL